MCKTEGMDAQSCKLVVYYEHYVFPVFLTLFSHKAAYRWSCYDCLGQLSQPCLYSRKFPEMSLYIHRMEKVGEKFELHCWETSSCSAIEVHESGRLPEPHPDVVVTNIAQGRKLLQGESFVKLKISTLTLCALAFERIVISARLEQLTLVMDASCADGADFLSANTDHTDPMYAKVALASIKLIRKITIARPALNSSVSCDANWQAQWLIETPTYHGCHLCLDMCSPEHVAE